MSLGVSCFNISSLFLIENSERFGALLFDFSIISSLKESRLFLFDLMNVEILVDIEVTVSVLTFLLSSMFSSSFSLSFFLGNTISLFLAIKYAKPTRNLWSLEILLMIVLDNSSLVGLSE